MKFVPDSPFSKELKNRVRNQILSRPENRVADRGVWLKAAVLIFMTISCYWVMVLTEQSWIEKVATTLLLSVSALFLGLNVIHEAVHGNYSLNPRVNRFLAYSFDFFGISSDLYRIKHTQFHHNYTNLYGHDGDISETPVIRLSHEQALYKIHRYQAYYAPFLYSLITLTWPLSDFSRLITGKIGHEPFKRPALPIVIKILFWKIIHAIFAYGIPIYFLGLKNALILNLLFHLTLGFAISLIFQVAHVVSSCEISNQKINHDWFVHQILTSADFGTNNKILNYWMGGLNFQVIHHLFPNVSYRHFPEIKKLTKELCAEHNLEYREYPSFSSAVVSHFKQLNRLGAEG